MSDNRPMEMEEENGYVTLMSANGEEIDFVEIAGIALDGNFYAILQPVQLLDGMAEDEAMVFKVTRTEDGNDSFTIVLDDAVIDGVFEIYTQLYNEATQGQE